MLLPEKRTRYLQINNQTSNPLDACVELTICEFCSFGSNIFIGLCFQGYVITRIGANIVIKLYGDIFPTAFQRVKSTSLLVISVVDIRHSTNDNLGRLLIPLTFTMPTLWQNSTQIKSTKLMRHKDLHRNNQETLNRLTWRNED